MTSQNRLRFDAEKELHNSVPDVEDAECEIMNLFLKLSKDRQKSILSELWNEIKPERPKGYRNFDNLPY